MGQDLAVEDLELPAVVEVSQVREFMTQRVDQARVLERGACLRVTQPDSDASILLTDPVTTPHRGALSRKIAQP